jgi:tRNA (guanine-N7-)-methyltransferase
MRSKSAAKEEIKQFTDYVFLNTEEISTHKNNWRKTCFKPDQKLYLELGMGKGQFVCTLATKHPQNAYLAIEIKEERVLSAAKKATKQQIPNVRFICGDFKTLPELFGEGEIDGMYINCPDPWPKKRHAKRRCTNQEWLKIYKSILKPDGWLKLKTDDQNFFEFSQEALMLSGWKTLEESVDVEHKPELETEDERFVVTEFETKWRGRGKNIYYLQASPQAA